MEMVIKSQLNIMRLFRAPHRYIATKNVVLDKQLLRPIYMDYQATTPLDPRVLDSMLPYMTHCPGNAHSRSHFYGWESDYAVETAREKVARLINASPQEVIFTSGATESNNLALKGVAHFYGRKRNHIITTQIEHKCVLDSCRVLENEGFEVSYLPVKKSGLIDLELLESSIRKNTCLVSIMGVHNEIGVVQPIREIGDICKRNRVFFHCDAAQTVGKVYLDVKRDKIDLLSISGHKIYGPKGVGALYVNRTDRVRVQPQISGGGQERGLRSGTLPVNLVVGLGEAADICLEEIDYDYAHVEKLSRTLLEGLFSGLSHIIRNGDPENSYPGCINISFSYVEGESLLMATKDVALSSGSACTSSTLEPSYVLRGLNASEENSHSSIRFGIGRFTTMEQVQYTVDLVVEKVKKLRQMSPLWEMVQDGIDLSTIKWTGH